MKVAVRDSDAFQSLPPREVAAYLRGRGWNEISRLGTKGSVWVLRTDDHDEYELLLPLDRTLRDFKVRMSEVLATLEQAEQRSQLEILQDLSTVAGDLVRIRLDRLDVHNGTIPLDVGVKLIESVRDLVAAAACAAVAPKPYYQARRPAQVVEYMQKVRLGQTQQGSYVVNVLSRVPPEVAVGQMQLPFATPPEDPYERKVTTTLASGLAVARGTIDSYGSIDDVQRIVAHGVSSNLCEALAAIGRDESVQEVDISFAWATTRPLSRSVPHSLVFPSDSIPVIGEFGRILRDTAPHEDVEVAGVVTKLERQGEQDEGTATIFGTVDGAPRKVRVYLQGADHTRAIEAYRDRLPVTCVGDLVKDGQSFVLRNPRGFMLAGDSEG